MKLRANRPLIGEYGRIREGEVFETDHETAEYLMSRGLVEVAYEPPDPGRYVAGLNELFRPVAKSRRA